MRSDAKDLALWSFLLAIIGAAGYFASLQKPEGRRVPWIEVAIIALAWGLRFLVRRIPVSPEMAAALAQWQEERQHCRRCGSSRRTDDVFCNTCHPRLPGIIAIVTAVGLAWAGWLLVKGR